jgi:hypothetical protein
MKEENRLIKLSDGREINLPLGLTYDMGEVALCTECGGVVTEMEPLVHRSKYRNRAFEQDFPARNGVCLKCTQILMTNVIARFFTAAENAVKTFNDLDNSATKDEDTERKLDVYEQSIEAMQLFIERLGSFVGDADTHKVEYAHEPEQRPDIPQESPDDEASQEG